MDFSLAFNLTLNHFGITARSLAEQSGINEVMISRFRNGHQIKTETLSRLLECLPVHQREYFFSIMAGSENSKNQIRSSVESWIEIATVEELRQTMLLISHKCSGQNSRNFEQHHSVA